MRTASFVVALLAAVAVVAQDDKTYQVKIKHTPDAGESVVVRENVTQKVAMTVSDETGKVLNRENTVGKEELEYTLTVTEKKGDRPTKYQRAYKKAVNTVGKKKVTASYEGRTVLYERKGDAYQVRGDGKPDLDKKELDKLTKEANEDKDKVAELFLPEKAVKVGESWKLSAKAIKGLGKDLGEIDEKKSQGKCKLLKVYRKGTQTWGVIELDVLLLAGKVMDLTFTKPASFRMKGTIETAIDGSSAAGKDNGTVSIEGTAKTKIGETAVVIDMKIEITGVKERTMKK